MVILSGWSKEIHIIVLPTVDKRLGSDIARIHHMLLRQHIVKSQSCMNVRKSLIIRLRGWAGFDMGDHVRKVIITRLGEMHFVAHPLHLSLLDEKGFRIIRRIDQCSGGWSIGEIAPTQLSFLPLKILDPDTS
jgi:hypothetical protein